MTFVGEKVILASGSIFSLHDNAHRGDFEPYFQSAIILNVVGMISM
jgi:hypothetical protein